MRATFALILLSCFSSYLNETQADATKQHERYTTRLVQRSGRSLARGLAVAASGGGAASGVVRHARDIGRKNVLIIGGGDGGMVREVLKHPDVERVTLVEIDERVIEVSKKYLPHLSSSLQDPKVSIVIEDGFEFLERHVGEFDVIITDSSDPKGPALCLFEKPYYELLAAALKPGGIIASQATTVWDCLPQVERTYKHCKAVFPVTAYAVTSVPTYPSGQIGFLMGALDSVSIGLRVCLIHNSIFKFTSLLNYITDAITLSFTEIGKLRPYFHAPFMCDRDFNGNAAFFFQQTNLSQPVRVFSEEDLDRMELKYYNDKVHRAAFVLPRFVEKALATHTPSSSTGDDLVHHN
ncbi:PREDICTED: spermidine synthase isoform X2 [Dinoponera quadriceps]|uniref:Spermidine synthase isoform X2 n=1 Tax=Dinoponera quadriceps TaxID=609295 RepID=A0A6P3X9H9_DINQU|nr:PREDICTED: spermidine synthase isoform X2 [Dinoponera quadriceps]